MQNKSGNGQGQAGSPSISGTRQAGSTKQYLPSRPGGGKAESKKKNHTSQKGK